MSRLSNRFVPTTKSVRLRALSAMLAVTFLCPALRALPRYEHANKDSDSVLGTWRGESKCLVRPSACQDEHSVYRVTAGQTAARVRLEANKIVDGREANMGDAECGYNADTKSIDCALPNGNSMRLHAKANVMDGTMTLRDGTLWRKITLRRDQGK